MLTAEDVEQLPLLGERQTLSRRVQVPPLSYTFVVLPEADAEACR